MTFVSKYGSRTSTEDLYREALQRWRNCVATIVLFFLVLVNNAVTVSPSSIPNIRPLQDLLANVQVTSSAKECQVATTCDRPALPNQLLRSGSHQCLYLDDENLEIACKPTMRDQVHLRFCDHYTLAHVLAGDHCSASSLAQMVALDDSVRLLACQFRTLLDRYDCNSTYSVSWTCEDCKRAYRNWVCAMFLPFHLHGVRLKPCRYICRLVEQKCPYFHPSVKEQYAGERVFKCIDPNIPDLQSISEHSAYGAPGRCYCLHHLHYETSPPGDSECLTTGRTMRHNSSSDFLAPVAPSMGKSINCATTAVRMISVHTLLAPLLFLETLRHLSWNPSGWTTSHREPT